MIYDRTEIDEVTNEDLDFLMVDIVASENREDREDREDVEVESEYKKAFNKLFDLTRKYVDSRTTTTNNEN